MDTSSHICMGVGFGILAASAATALNIPIAGQTILFITILASLIPDIDVVLKIKSNDVYINNHRGISHSIIFLFIWTFIITSIFGYNQPNIVIEFIFVISFIATLAHLITDLLNGYGIQFLWPFYPKWIMFGITYTFDLLMIVSHIIAFIVLYYSDINSYLIFETLYGLIILYIIIQFFYQASLKKDLIRKYRDYKRVVLISKAMPHTWKYAYETKSGVYYVGIIKGKEIIQQKEERKVMIHDPKLFNLLRHDRQFRSFLNFSPIYNFRIEKTNGILEIRCYDLRYLMEIKNELHYSFNAICHIKDNQILDSYMGFIFSEDTLQKKIYDENSPIKKTIKILKGQ